MSVFLGNQSPVGCTLHLMRADTKEEGVVPIGWHHDSVYSTSANFSQCGLQALVTTDGFTRYRKKNRLQGDEVTRNERYKQIAFQLPQLVREQREAEWLEAYRSVVSALIASPGRLSTTNDDITGVYVAPQSLVSVWNDDVEHPEQLHKLGVSNEHIKQSYDAFATRPQQPPSLLKGSIYRAIEGAEAMLSRDDDLAHGHMRMVKLSREGALGSDGLPVQWLDARVLEDGTAIIALATADPTHTGGAFAAAYAVEKLLLQVMHQENLPMKLFPYRRPQANHFAGFSGDDCKAMVTAVLEDLKNARKKWKDDSAQITSLALAFVHPDGLRIAYAGDTFDVGTLEQGSLQLYSLPTQSPISAAGDSPITLVQKNGFFRDLFFAPKGTAPQLAHFVNPLDQTQGGFLGICSLMRQVPTNVAADALVQQLDDGALGLLPPSFAIVQMAAVNEHWVSALTASSDGTGPVLLPKVKANAISVLPTVTGVVAADPIDWKNVPEPTVDRSLLKKLGEVEFEKYTDRVRATWEEWWSHQDHG